MNEQAYGPPVDQLLSLGDEMGGWEFESWLDYPARFGLTAEHIPDLIRIVEDPLLTTQINELAEDDPRNWASLHAWRALGQLRAEAAIQPLLALFTSLEDWDDVFEELPNVFGLIGPAAIPALVEALHGARDTDFPAISYASCLRQIGQMHPAVRDEIVGVFTGLLAEAAANQPTLNAFIISDLIDLKAVEAAPVMEQAFAADHVDWSIAGDWEDVQIALGLLAERITPKPNYTANLLPELIDLMQLSPSAQRRRAESKRKAKRKQAQASRKKNRKKRR